MRRLLLAGVLLAGPALANRGDQLLDAARSDDRAAVSMALKQGADVNAREEDGTTPLAWAANRGNLAVAEMLLGAGASPNLATELGITPLALARFTPLTCH